MPDTHQADLFASRPEPSADDAPDAAATPLAVPCGYRDRRNAPCRRLARAPLMIDGQPLANRNRPLLHCDPACFRGDPERTVDDPPPHPS